MNPLIPLCNPADDAALIQTVKRRTVLSQHAAGERMLACTYVKARVWVPSHVADVPVKELRREHVRSQEGANLGSGSHRTR